MLVKWHLSVVQPNITPFDPGILGQSLVLYKRQVPHFKKKWGSRWPCLCHRALRVLHDTICIKMSWHYEVKKKNTFLIINNSFDPKERGAYNYLPILIRIMATFLSSPTSLAFFQNHSFPINFGG